MVLIKRARAKTTRAATRFTSACPQPLSQPLVARPALRYREFTSGDFTATQGQYLAYIYAYRCVLERSPGEADLERFFRVQRRTVHRIILALDYAGFIRRRPGNMELLISPELLPVLLPVRRTALLMSSETGPKASRVSHTTRATSSQPPLPLKNSTSAGDLISAVVAERMRAGLTRQRFAALLGISLGTLNQWETRRANPPAAARSLLRIATRRPDVLRDLFAEECKSAAPVLISTVADARVRAGLSQPNLAALLGISVRTLEGWEHHGRLSKVARTLLTIVALRPDVLREGSRSYDPV